MLEQFFDFDNWQWKTKSMSNSSTNLELLSALFVYSTSAGGAIDNKIEQAMVSRLHLFVCLFICNLVVKDLPLCIYIVSLYVRVCFCVCWHLFVCTSVIWL